MLLSSPAFENGTELPARYSHGQENMFPPLEWEGSPEATRSFALRIRSEYQSGISAIHCLLYNIPANCKRIDAREVADGQAQTGIFAENGFGRSDYDGPEGGCGKQLYVCELLALDVPALTAPPDVTADDLWKKLNASAIARVSLTTIVG